MIVVASARMIEKFHSTCSTLFLMPTTDPFERDYYKLPDVPRTASSAEVEASYHQLLLSPHPDKSDTSKDNPTLTNTDIGQLKDAFVILSSLRDPLYDSELCSRPDSSPSRSRPAHIVSLEDFDNLGQGWATAAVVDSILLERGIWKGAYT